MMRNGQRLRMIGRKEAFSCVWMQHSDGGLMMLKLALHGRNHSVSESKGTASAGLTAAT